ncbi:ATP synthase subunit c family protein, partial [Streptococcus agalactiae]
FSKLQTLMFTGVAFIEGTFFVLFAFTFLVR